MAVKSETMQWSKKSILLKDVIRDHKLPIVVKVAEGWLGDNEDESFALGDLVKLDFVQCIQSVRAFADEQEILIPLVHKGKIKILCSNDQTKFLNSVQDIVKSCPRYLLNKMTFTSERTEHITAKKVCDGEVLEFDRYIEGKGLVCKKKGTSDLVVLSENKRYKFSVEKDDNVYSISEIVDRFPFPQHVMFIEQAGQNFTEGNDAMVINLVELTSQDYVVCHHKPDPALLGQGQIMRRYYIMLPTNKELFHELEVCVAIDMASTGYAMFVEKNFSKQISSNQVVNKLENEKLPTGINLLYLNIEDELEDDTPPPLPPRRLNSVQEEVKSVQKSEYDYIKVDNKATNEATDSKEKGSKIQKLLHSVKKKLPRQTTDIHQPTMERPSNIRESQHDYEMVDSDNDLYEQLDESTLSMDGKATGKPTVAVPPTSRSPPLKQRIIGRPLPNPHEKQTEDKDLDKMTVDELVDCLEMCKIDKLARTCEEKGLDGCFLSSLNDEELKKPPFSLELIDIIKLHDMKKGWRPKLCKH